MSDPAPAVPKSEADALEGFLGKWRARWPEWVVMEAFVPQAQRATVLAWAALQQEMTDAAWGGQDPRPGELKLAWWQEELHGWTKGRRRHPLGSVLQRHQAPWATLAAALPQLPASRERARDPEEAVAALRGFSESVAMVDGALFAPGDASAAAADASVVTAVLLAARAVQPGDAHLPLSEMLRADREAALASWREHLVRSWPAPAASTRPRRLWAALASARLGQADPARPLGSWRALTTAWRGARTGRN